ncbi:MAG TPA: 50S ribosomal protein L20 [bacterium]|nr:50S ribosomal protein L20 [bacterium]HQL61178.1 50S ribosomal protein L20 [bacterium]
MPRAMNRVASHRRRRKLIRESKGQQGGRRNLLFSARDGRQKALQYAYRDRKNRKREFRGLWVTRIAAAAKLNGMSYSRLMGYLRNAGIDVNRKMLSELAIHDPDGFRRLVEQVSPAG